MPPAASQPTPTGGHPRTTSATQGAVAAEATAPPRRRADKRWRSWGLTACIVLVTLAGCTEPAEPVLDTGSGQGTQMTIEGIVRDPAFRPIANATVSLRGFGSELVTGGDGLFAFVGLEPRVYLVDASAPGHLNASVAVRPTEGIAGADVILQPLPPVTATQRTQAYRGVLQCAKEAIIISGSCDVLLAFANDAVEPAAGTRPLPEPLEADHVFEFHVDADWTTLVVDVVFDPSAHPGLAGLRTVLRGNSDSGGLATYEQYGRWSSGQAYTFHVTPGETYSDGVGPVPGNVTLFRLEALPHSHAHHATCAAVCLLGAGAAVDFEFELFVTEWHVEPAPDGWSLRGDEA